MTTDQARGILLEWGQNKQEMIFNPGLLCPGCEGQLGSAYTNLYTTARQVFTGGNVNEQELIAAALTIQNLSDDQPG
jgi:hypothetical protein